MEQTPPIRRIVGYFADNSICWTSILAGLVQTLLYCDFFYYYALNFKQGKQSFTLPA